VDPLLLIAILGGALAVAAAILATVTLRSRSFSSRVDRRTARRHKFEQSWSGVLDEAERAAQAERQKARSDASHAHR
jgi:hypothetical protein